MTVSDGTTAPPALPVEDEWRRLHPLTPLLRGGRALLVVVGLLTSQSLRERPPLLLALGIVGVVSLVAVLVGFVAWRTTAYRVAGDELQVDSGVLVRRARRVPLARVQSIDVVRPLVARVLGLAELRLEVVGGGQTEAPLSYLSEADAQQLRARLLTISRGAPDPEAPPPVPEQVLVRVPTGVLLASVLLGAPLVVAVLLVPALVVTLLVEPRAVLPGLAALVPVLLGVGGVAVRRVLTEYGATVAETPEGLRLTSGLLDTRAQTVPAGRVQTVRVREPLLWRSQGWVRVEVDVAGYSPGGEQQTGSSALLPVAPRGLADAVVARVLGGPLPPPDRPVPARVRWRAPLSRRRLRLGVDDRHLVATSGVLTTTTDVVPLAKVQSLRLSDGPWQRRLRLADVRADSAGRRLPGASVRHRDIDEARALLEDLTRRTRAARRGRPDAASGLPGA